jgi:hypothetical protein
MLHLVDRAGLPRVRVEESRGAALVAGLVRVKSRKPFFVVGARPAPLVAQAPHRQKESLDAHNEIDCFGLLRPRRELQNLLL